MPDGENTGVTRQTGGTTLPPEENRERRGHDFYPAADVLATIPALYATEDTPSAEKLAHLHYSVNGSDWYVTELDHASGLAYGWTKVGQGYGEWGPFGLPHLERINRGPLIVKRDLSFTPTRAGDIGQIASAHPTA